MRDLVLRTDDEGIASLTLNRPDALNALSPNLFMELREHLEIINAQSEETGPANEWVSDGSLIDRTIAVAPKNCRQFLAHSPR